MIGKKILRLVSATSLARAANTSFSSSSCTAAALLPRPGSLYLSASTPPPCAHTHNHTHVPGLTGRMCWWCRCEETRSAGRLLAATAPLLRDKRRTDLHTLAAIALVKACREGDCCGRTETHRREEGGWWAGLRGWTSHAAAYTCPVLHQLYTLDQSPSSPTRTQTCGIKTHYKQI